MLTRWFDAKERLSSAKVSEKEYWKLQVFRGFPHPTPSDPLAQRSSGGWYDTNLHAEWFPKLKTWRIVRSTLEKRGHTAVTKIVYLGRFDTKESAQNFAEATYLLGEP